MIDAVEWETLPKSHRINHVLDILSAPICGMDDFTAFDSLYLDPGELLLSSRFSPPRTHSNENRWQDIVSLVIRGLSGREEARRRASIRMVGVVLLDKITDDEKSQLALALWGKDYSNHNDLPSNTRLKDWSFPGLLEPESGIAEQRFRQKWLNSEILNKRDNSFLDEILWNIGSVISGLKADRSPMVFSDNERDYLLTLITQWSEIQVSYPRQRRAIQTLIQQDFEEKAKKPIVGLQSVLLEVKVPESVAEKLYEKIQTLANSNVPVLGLTAGLIKALPERFDEIVLSMKMGLGSEEKHLARDAALGLWFWLRAVKDSPSGMRTPPDDLIREIGIIIAMRRKATLEHALQVANWIFSEGDQKQRGIITELVLSGLEHLAQELCYNNERNRSTEIDIPLLRWGCTHLALSMARCGFKKYPAIIRWVENLEDDPLPEIRNVRSFENL